MSTSPSSWDQGPCRDKRYCSHALTCECASATLADFRGAGRAHAPRQAPK
jgi:hypothetical protein